MSIQKIHGGCRTKDYIIKWNLFKQLYTDIDFREV